MTDHGGVSGIDAVPDLVRRLYEIIDELGAAFPGRPFTPDGHLVGSIGEVLAAHAYDLDLLPPSEPVHDARSRDGRLVQIKATQARSVGLRAEPDHLLVLKLKRDGSVHEVFNGPGPLAWHAAGKLQKNGQCPISLSRLGKLMESVPRASQLPTAQPFTSRPSGAIE